MGDALAERNGLDVPVMSFLLLLLFAGFLEKGILNYLAYGSVIWDAVS